MSVSANARRVANKVRDIFKKHDLRLHTSEIARPQNEKLRLFYAEGITRPQLVTAILELGRLGVLTLEYDDNSRITAKAINQPVDKASRRHVRHVKLDELPSGTFVLNPDPPVIVKAPSQRPTKKNRSKEKKTERPLLLSNPNTDEQILKRAAALIASLAARVQVLEDDNRRLRTTPSLQFIDVATDWRRFLHEALAKLRAKAVPVPDSAWGSLGRIDCVDLVEGAHISRPDARRLVEKLEQVRALKVCAWPSACCHVLMEPVELPPQALRRAGVELGEADELRVQLAARNAQYARLEQLVAELTAQRDALQVRLETVGLSAELREEIEKVLRRTSL